MHYVIHVFDDGKKSLEERMAPHKEYHEKTESGQDISGGHWDFWSVGGRWEGYFGGTRNEVTVGEILDQTASPHFDSPFGFIDLLGNWHVKELYVPSGFLDDEHGYGTPRLSYFLPLPRYEEMYWEFLKSYDRSVKVITVDIHR